MQRGNADALFLPYSLGCAKPLHGLSAAGCVPGSKLVSQPLHLALTGSKRGLRTVFVGRTMGTTSNPLTIQAERRGILDSRQQVRLKCLATRRGDRSK